MMRGSGQFQSRAEWPSLHEDSEQCGEHSEELDSCPQSDWFCKYMGPSIQSQHEIWVRLSVQTGATGAVQL